MFCLHKTLRASVSPNLIVRVLWHGFTRGRRTEFVVRHDSFQINVFLTYNTTLLTHLILSFDFSDVTVAKPTVPDNEELLLFFLLSDGGLIVFCFLIDVLCRPPIVFGDFFFFFLDVCSDASIMKACVNHMSLWAISILWYNINTTEPKYQAYP